MKYSNSGRKYVGYSSAIDSMQSASCVTKTQDNQCGKVCRQLTWPPFSFSHKYFPWIFWLQFLVRKQNPERNNRLIEANPIILGIADPKQMGSKTFNLRQPLTQNFSSRLYLKWQLALPFLKHQQMDFAWAQIRKKTLEFWVHFAFANVFGRKGKIKNY